MKNDKNAILGLALVIVGASCFTLVTMLGGYVLMLGIILEFLGIVMILLSDK